eukprot:4940_1
MQKVPFLTRSTSSNYNPTVERLLSKYHDREDEPHEIVKICTNITKINKRNKKQNRVLVLTDQAVYNIKSKTIKRRIPLSQVAAITQSAVSPEFTLNVPSEYDYRFEAKSMTSQQEIISAISSAITDLNHEVLINTINDSETAKWTLTKSDLELVDNHYDKNVRTVLAVVHLECMGFKSKVARKSLLAHDGHLSLTVQALVGDYVNQLEEDKSARSPFKSPSSTPVSHKVSPNLSPTTSNSLSPTLSYTETVDEAFSLAI